MNAIATSNFSIGAGLFAELSSEWARNFHRTYNDRSPIKSGQAIRKYLDLRILHR